MQDSNKLNIDQFFDDMLMLTSESTFSDIYIDENIDFFKDINFYLYNQYTQDRITLNLAADILENFMQIKMKHKPDLTNILPDDFGNQIED